MLEGQPVGEKLLQMQDTQSHFAAWLIWKLGKRLVFAQVQMDKVCASLFTRAVLVQRKLLRNSEVLVWTEPPKDCDLGTRNKIERSQVMESDEVH